MKAAIECECGACLEYDTVLKPEFDCPFCGEHWSPRPALWNRAQTCEAKIVDPTLLEPVGGGHRYDSKSCPPQR